MVGAVARRPVTVAVQTVLAREQAIERVQQVVIGAGADLDHDQSGRRVRHEDREEAVVGTDVADECGAGCGQIGNAAR
jgi:hypothetical protein